MCVTGLNWLYFGGKSWEFVFLKFFFSLTILLLVFLCSEALCVAQFGLID